MIRCSRPMSCAVASTWPSGGRRSTQRRPLASVTRKVRFEWPPAMRSNSSGADAAGTCCSNHPVTPARSIPSTSAATLAPIGVLVRSERPNLPAEPATTRPTATIAGMVDVTDATFQTAVIERSMTVPVVVDLWAEWCGPCRTLGPIIEKVVAETDGKVELAKVDVDANPGISQAFRVQSIPAVYAIVDRGPVGQFRGALPEHEVREFVQKLLPAEEETEVQRLLRAGDEASLRAALELEPDSPEVVVALAELLANDGRGEEALALL